MLDARYGLDAGFSEYRQPPPHGSGETAFRPLPAEEQVRRFRAWLAARSPGRPFFAWVHLWEPHAPYEEWAGDERRAGTDAETDDAAVLFLFEVCLADFVLYALLASVDPATTLVIVTSDHGEALGEHGEATHGLLCYGATMDVPLVMAGPEVPRGRVEGAPRGLHDVAPTLRRLCGLPPAPGPGADLLAPPPARVVCGESLYANRLYGWAQQSCATDGRFSLVDGGPRLELFDLAADPRETSPLPDPTLHPAYAPLDRALLAYRATRGPGGRGDPLATAPAYYGSLRIAVGDFLKPAENRALRDVHLGLGDVALLDRVNAAIEGRQALLAQGLLPELRLLEDDDRANPAPCLARGRALLLVLGRPLEAAEALEEARTRGYRSPDLLALLERAYAEAGDEASAARVREERKNPPR